MILGFLWPCHMPQRLGADEIIGPCSLLFHVCLTAIRFLCTVVRVSHHFHSLSFLTQERCDDPIVFGDHGYKQHSVLLEVMVEEGGVTGLSSDSLLTVRDQRRGAPRMPHPSSRTWERILRISDCNSCVSPGAPGSGSLRIRGGRAGGGLLICYLVNLLEEENGFFLFPTQTTPPFCISPSSSSLESQTSRSLSRPGPRDTDSPGQWQGSGEAKASMGRQTDRPPLNQKLGYGDVTLKIAESTPYRLLTKAVSRC